MQPPDRTRKGITLSIGLSAFVCVAANVHPGDMLAASPLVSLDIPSAMGIVKSRCVCTCLCAVCYFMCQMSDVQHFQDD